MRFPSFREEKWKWDVQYLDRLNYRNWGGSLVEVVSGCKVLSKCLIWTQKMLDEGGF